MSTIIPQCRTLKLALPLALSLVLSSTPALATGDQQRLRSFADDASTNALLASIQDLSPARMLLFSTVGGLLFKLNPSLTRPYVQTCQTMLLKWAVIAPLSCLPVNLLMKWQGQQEDGAQTLPAPTGSARVPFPYQ